MLYFNKILNSLNLYGFFLIYVCLVLCNLFLGWKTQIFGIWCIFETLKVSNFLKTKVWIWKRKNDMGYC